MNIVSQGSPLSVYIMDRLRYLRKEFTKQWKISDTKNRKWLANDEAGVDKHYLRWAFNCKDACGFLPRGNVGRESLFGSLSADVNRISSIARTIESEVRSSSSRITSTGNPEVYSQLNRGS